jgi:hypothetical protein
MKTVCPSHEKVDLMLEELSFHKSIDLKPQRKGKRVMKGHIEISTNLPDKKGHMVIFRLVKEVLARVLLIPLNSERCQRASLGPDSKRTTC